MIAKVSKKRIILFFFSFFVCGSYLLRSQHINADSLLQAAQSGTDHEKQQMYFQLVNIYKNSNPRLALPYLEFLLEHSLLLKDDLLMAKAYQLCGAVFLKLGNFSSAKKHYQEALAYFTKAQNPKGKNEVTLSIASIYFSQGNLPASAELYLNSLRYYEEINDKSAILSVLNALGSVYARQNNFSKALEYNLRAIALYEESSDKLRTLVTYDNIGNIYIKQGNYQKAHEYFSKSLRMYGEMNNKAGLASTYYQLGNLSAKLSKYEDALVMYDKALSIASELSIFPLMVSCYNGSALCNFNLKRYKKAESNFEAAISLAKKLDMKLELEEAYEGISTLYKTTQKEEKATTFRALSKELKDSLYNDSNIKRLADMQLLYEAEKKQQKIELLFKEQQLKELELQREKQIRGFFIYASVALVFVFIGLTYFAVVNRKNALSLKRQRDEMEKQNLEISAQKEQLNQLNNVKDRFFSIISHDLRNNLTTMKLYFDLISNPDYKAEDQTILTKQIAGSVENTIDLLENLLVWASAQIKGVSIHIQKINLNSVVEQSKGLLEVSSEQKSITISNELSEELVAYADIDMVNLVVRNLISNAIKFTPNAGKIRIYSSLDVNNVNIHISDNGIGIGPDNLKNLFNQHLHPSTKGTGNEKGTGLGLMLCKDFIEKNGGCIWVESEKGKGSTFSFSLPAKV